MKRILKIACLILVISGISLWFFQMRSDKQHLKFVEGMGVGINIGNSLDATSVRRHKPNADVVTYETFWKNPVQTKELYTAIKSYGFGTVRIPVTWDEHMDENGSIDKEWMNRVKEVVNYALDSGLYVILDTHHESWLIPTPEKEQATSKRLIRLWSQIANEFSDQGQRLLFEGMNEPRLVDSDLEWTAGNKEMRAVVNRLNQDFVKAVRESGGKNVERYLLIGGYGTTYYEDALLDIELPKDDRIILSVHAYLPYAFTLANEKDQSFNPQKEKDTKKILTFMSLLNEQFIKKNTPVMITEFACHDKGNQEEQLEWAQYYTQNAQRNGLSYIWWDNGAESKLIDRTEYTLTKKELLEVLLKKP